ncbi:MAG: DUF4129 domain-containing protein [Alkalinema sp. RU_4_3]|nr:DUF4129 domain-containing protein [Alkalinema sp. RU_4_3]
MASVRFEKNSIGWQLQQVKQSVGEAIEQFLSNLRLNPNPPKPNAKPTNIDWNWLAYWRYFLVTVVVLLLVVWLVWWLGPIVRGAVGRWQARENPQGPGPQVPTRSAGLLIQDARDYGARGNYREACRALYLATLQQLNDRKILQHQLSRTDGEYGRLVEPLNTAEAHRTILNIHEQITFRPGPVDAATFKACEQAYGEIDRTVEPASKPTGSVR